MLYDELDRFSCACTKEEAWLKICQREETRDINFQKYHMYALSKAQLTNTIAKKKIWVASAPVGFLTFENVRLCLCLSVTQCQTCPKGFLCVDLLTQWFKKL